MIDAYLADPANNGKAISVKADELGVSRQAIYNHEKTTKCNTLQIDAEPKGYDPKVKTERVEAAWAIWKQMNPDEQDHLMRLIVNFKNRG